MIARRNQGPEKHVSKKITTPEMETALMRHFNPRVNLVVPNVSWGFLPHEADLLVMTKAGYLYEVEIKVSLSDLKKDADKTHGHSSCKIKHLYFAVPDYLLDRSIPHIPERAGILTVNSEWWYGWYGICRNVNSIRPPQTNGNYKLSEAEKYKIARLGALRILSLKERLEVFEQEKRSNKASKNQS